MQELVPSGRSHRSTHRATKVGLAQDSKLDRQFEARLEAALLHAAAVIQYLAVESMCKS